MVVRRFRAARIWRPTGSPVILRECLTRWGARRVLARDEARDQHAPASLYERKILVKEHTWAH